MRMGLERISEREEWMVSSAIRAAARYGQQVGCRKIRGARLHQQARAFAHLRLAAFFHQKIRG